jgi:hypothetical protein
MALYFGISMTQTATSLSFHFQEVDQKPWPDMERLFKVRSRPKSYYGKIFGWQNNI